MTAEEQRLIVKRSEYAFVTIMNKYKKKDAYNYMPKFKDVSILSPNGSKYVRILGESKEFIKLVKKQSFNVMCTKTHVRKLKVKTLVDSGCSMSIFTNRSLFSDYTPYKTSIQTAGGVIHSTGRGTVGNLPNCLYVPELNVNLISTSYAYISDNRAWRS